MGKRRGSCNCGYGTRDFRTTVMQAPISPATNAQQVLLEEAWALFAPCMERLNWAAVRLIGVRAAGLGSGGAQLMLLTDRPARLCSVNAALDTIRTRHGTHAIRPALTLLTREGTRTPPTGTPTADG